MNPAELADDPTMRLLEELQRRIAAHGPESEEVRSFIEENRGDADFQELAHTALRVEVTRWETQALPGRPVARRSRLPIIWGVLLLLALVSGLAIFLYSVGFARQTAASLAVTEETLSETKVEYRSFANTEQQAWERLNDLAPVVEMGLKSNDPDLRARSIKFVYSFAERLSPAEYERFVPPLLKILDEPKTPSDVQANYAKGALERMSKQLYSHGSKEAIAAVEKSLDATKNEMATRHVMQGKKLARSAAKTQTVRVPFEMEAALTDTDGLDRVRTSSFSKIYLASLQQGLIYQIDMTSSRIDPFLRLEDASTRELAFNDDGGGLLNARIVFVPERTGLYRIIATTFQGKQTGHFELSIKERDPTLAFRAADKLVRGPFEPLRNVKAFYKDYQVKLQANQRYLIDLKSKEFDAYLIVSDLKGVPLRNAEGMVLQDDDSGDERDARIWFTPPADGTYRLVVTSYLAAEGAFELTVRTVSPQAATR